MSKQEGQDNKQMPSNHDGFPFAGPSLYDLEPLEYSTPDMAAFPRRLDSTDMSYQDFTDSFPSTAIQSPVDYYQSDPNQSSAYVEPSELTLSRSQDSYPQSSSSDDSHYADYSMQPPAAFNQSSTPTTHTNTLKGEIWACLLCTNGQFTRAADLNRHYTTCHTRNEQKYDCPKIRCGRKGDQGFTRKDHLAEHLRSYHKDPSVPTRPRRK